MFIIALESDDQLIQEAAFNDTLYGNRSKCQIDLSLPFIQPTGGNSPHSPIAPTEPTPLSKELADANATEKTKVAEPENTEGRLGDLHFKLR